MLQVLSFISKRGRELGMLHRCDLAIVGQAADLPEPLDCGAPLGQPQLTAGQKAVKAAESKIGAPYSYGSAGPNAFDCSGLIYWSYKQAGKNIPRDSYGQLGGGRSIPISDLQAGDIVIYNGGSHAALYIGNGKVVHSVNYGIPVKVSPLNEMSVYSARRY